MKRGARAKKPPAAAISIDNAPLAGDVPLIGTERFRPQNSGSMRSVLSSNRKELKRNLVKELNMRPDELASNQLLGIILFPPVAGSGYALKAVLRVVSRRHARSSLQIARRSRRIRLLSHRQERMARPTS